MKNINVKKTLLAVSVISAVSLSGIAHAVPQTSYQEQEEKNILVGMGSGALIGAGVAGPVGGIIGGVLGMFIGDDVSKTEQNQDLQVRLKHSETALLAMQKDYEATLFAYQQLQKQQGQVQVAAMEKSRSPVALDDLLAAKANIQFKTASWQLEQHYVEQLDKVAAQLKSDPKLMVQLFGYADRRGDEDYNLQLSEKRADQVKRYLLSVGVNAAQIETAGYGEAQPVTVEQTWEDDFFDRRVVVRLTSDDSVMTAKQ
ncbi:sortase-associated OmpA-like protein PdsO [Planctobacterium marinum]|uniref:sortase-associated OmpA-like protein PdsO n=1 Tax=Planctobacterium marinum TaxID=1631968 RepID=UPI001E2C8999|nr:sortase-associated OmpA-like protein PdsO [Planctobacterium marinum]MCC2607251.1 sortase-associated OmpA-like protein PdsO [Planctobacterium marinum]